MKQLAANQYRDEILKGNILIVEDETVSRLLIRQIFAKEGFYNIWEAANGREAIEKLDWIIPDIIISDINMPEMDGFELCRNIRKSRDLRIAMIPILIQTSMKSIKDRDKIFKAGATDYLTKPIDHQEMLARAIVHLEREAVFKRLLELNGKQPKSRNDENNFWYSKRFSEIANLLLDKIEQNRNDLVKAKDKAIKADQLKTQFLANVSHELKTPIHCIVNYAQIGISDSKKQNFKRTNELFDDIFSNGNRLDVLIKDLIDISKIETGNFDVTTKPCLIHEILNNAIKHTKAIAEKKNIKIIVKGSDTEEISVDENRIEQVFINILSNAISFSPKNGKIICKIKNAELPIKNTDIIAPAIKITIEDEGPGIAEDNIRNIFEPFVHNRAGAVGKEKGTGLGLSISKAIVEAFSGNIKASNSQKGRGAIFEVTLPYLEQINNNLQFSNNNQRRNYV